MDELKFTAQTCTNIHQSQRLLEMGLKSETADMVWVCVTKEGFTQWVITLNTPQNKPNIPAWSLHKLIEILDIPYTEINNIGNNSLYDDLIKLIKNRIVKNLFNKEYLKQQEVQS